MLEFQNNASQAHPTLNKTRHYQTIANYVSDLTRSLNHDLEQDFDEGRRSRKGRLVPAKGCVEARLQTQYSQDVGCAFVSPCTPKFPVSQNPFQVTTPNTIPSNNVPHWPLLRHRLTSETLEQELVERWMRSWLQIDFGSVIFLSIVIVLDDFKRFWVGICFDIPPGRCL